MLPSVLFVSKPVDPPVNDGTKHFVMTLANYLGRHVPRVMTTRHVRDLGHKILADAIYESASSYAPSFLNNLRAARHLATGPRPDLWNFVFAPNPRSSKMGRLLKSLRRVPVVQTIASRPRHFERSSQLLFGDVIVAQSRDTRDRLLESWEHDAQRSAQAPKIELIPPPLGKVRVPTLEDTMAVRQALGVGSNVPMLLYPGDLEVSHGARIVKAAAVVAMQRHPTAVVVFAYRDKSPNSAAIASELKRDLNPSRVRFVRESPDIQALVRTSAALLFPVDDLYGKVDIPIVLLEAMALGTPVVTYRYGPLSDLEGVEVVRMGDPIALADSALALIDDHARRSRCVDAQRQTVERNHDAAHAAAAYETLYDALRVAH